MNENLLLLTEYFYPHWTGIAKAFFYLAKEIVKTGHNVTVPTTKFKDDLPREEDIEGMKILRSEHLLKISRTHYSISILTDFLSILKDKDGIIINSPNSNILFFTLLGKLFNKKVIIYHEGDLILPKLSGSRIKHLFLEKIFDVFTITSMSLSDRVSTFTEDYATHSRVMKFFLHKFHPFIPQVEISQKEPPEAFKEKITELKKNHKLIGFAGRFVEEKGFDILFSAIPLVIKEIPEAHFIFAGQAKMDYEPFYEMNSEKLEELESHITLLGLLNDEELAEFYRNLDVFALSSRSDCFALTQLEGALMGVPIVVTDIPGARMLVKETSFGEVVKSKDPLSLAGGIIKVLKNRDNYLKYSVRVGAFLDKYREFKI